MRLLILAILILINAYFAMSEIAFISLNDAKIAKMAKEGNKKAKKIEKMLSTPSKFLATIQIGITFAGFFSSAFAADSFASELAPWLFGVTNILTLEAWNTIALVIITIILSYFSLIFGELVPKRMGMAYPEKIAYSVVGMISVLNKCTYPFVFLLTKSTNIFAKIFGIKETKEDVMTEEEIKAIISTSEDEGIIEEGEKDLIFNVFSFNDTEAYQIMTPKENVVSIDVNIERKELMDIIRASKFTRMPIYNKDKDNIIGILNIKDIIVYHKKYKRLNLLEIMHEAIIVDEHDKVDDVFKLLQHRHQAMVLVKNKEGDFIGIITMEDAIEEIVGNIFDEFDEVKE